VRCGDDLRERDDRAFFSGVIEEEPVAGPGFLEMDQCGGVVDAIPLRTPVALEVRIRVGLRVGFHEPMRHARPRRRGS
jgi:hypothetical protein